MGVQSLGQKDPLNWEMATGSSILAWMDRGARQATAHGVTKDLDRTHMCASTHILIMSMNRVHVSEFPRENKSETSDGFLHSWDTV